MEATDGLLSMPREIQLAWCAGVLSSRGSFTVSRRTDRQTSVCLTFQMRGQRDVLQQWKDCFYVTSKITVASSGSPAVKAHRLIIHGENLYRIMRLLRPYLAASKWADYEYKLGQATNG